MSNQKEITSGIFMEQDQQGPEQFVPSKSISYGMLDDGISPAIIDLLLDTQVGQTFEWNSNITSPYRGLEQNGQLVSRTTYSKLFAKIGTEFGIGDGLTTFGLPDMTGKTSIGAGTYTDPVSGVITRTFSQTLGAEAHVITGAQTGSHTHSVNDPTHVHAILGIANQGINAGQADDITAGSNFLTNTQPAATGISINATPAAAAHNNMQPSIVKRFYIRY